MVCVTGYRNYKGGALIKLDQPITAVTLAEARKAVQKLAKSEEYVLLYFTTIN